MRVDVETRGELTRGMSVFDERPWQQGSPNVEVVLEVNSLGDSRALLSQDLAAGRIIGS